MLVGTNEVKNAEAAILESEGVGGGDKFEDYGRGKKLGLFHFRTLPKQMPFLTISNKNISFKTQGNRLGAIVPPNKHLE